MKTVKRDLIALGIGAMILLGGSIAGISTLISTNCGRKGNTMGELTGKREYAKAAVIQYYNRSDQDIRSVMIYDLDGKKSLDGKLDADEIFVYRGGRGDYPLENFTQLRHTGISQWKHHVAPDAKNLLIGNNITPMTAEQRTWYSGILNADPVEAKN